ncbi:MAG TPA: HlyD family efflux transporter periplasmic adaptor subunit [Candidatus Paceibacterota bacterium]|jgi:HlyD family secretion protein|nr:HlyD family efflux transporter periplasmic adaptor subunit [Candidatus Paceibacterota bacterium]
MKSIKKYIARSIAFAGAHKIWTLIILVAIIGGGYAIYAKISNSGSETQYTLSVAHLGTLTQTVTGTGQVSALNQLDLTSKVSGTITSINVSVGDHVRKNDLIATIDSTDALRSLQSAQIAMEKLTTPPKAADVSEAQSSVTKSYDSGFSAVAVAFTDLPNIISGMKDMLYGQNGFLSDQRSSYLTPTAREYRQIAGQKYDTAVVEYNTALVSFKTLSRDSATSSIDKLLSDTYTMTKDVAEAVTSSRSAISFITSTQPEYDAGSASSAAANVNAWSNTTNADVSSILSARNTIQTSTNSLATLLSGTDTLDLQSQRLNLAQAQQTYDNYFIRAPFDGIVGKISASVYSQAGSAAIATIIGEQKISTISLNEIDAAKVKQGQPVAITFDAIDGLTATGTVSSVDLVGTVSSGVVTYNVKILINTVDPRIKPGMSLNATIVTEEKTGALLVPSSAIKTRGNIHYVQVLETAMTSSTNLTSSSTRSFARTSTNRAPAGITVTSTIAPTQVVVSIGDADDTNTEITSGLSAGQAVVTKTTTVAKGTTTTTATSGSLLGGLLGGNRQGANRTTTSGGANIRTTTSGASNATYVNTGAGGPPPGAL